MSNFNVNFSANFTKPVQTGSSQNIKTDSQPAVNTNTPTSNISTQSATPNSTLSLISDKIISRAMTLNILETKELAALIRELLSMPKDIQTLLALLVLGENDPSQLAKMLHKSKLELLINDLQKFIGDNSKEALNKLIHMTQNNALFFEGNQQFRDILGIIEKLTVMTKTSPNDALLAAFIVYLPWLPLAQEQKLDLTFGFKQETEEQSETTDEEILILFISTKTIGVFKITIILNKDNSLEIDIENDHVALSVINQIVTKINEEIGQFGLKSRIATTTRKDTEKRSPKQLKNDTNKSITIHPSGKISVITINTGYTIAKIVFSMDEKTEVLKNREEKIK